MQKAIHYLQYLVLITIPFVFSSCAYKSTSSSSSGYQYSSARMPDQISTHEKVIVVDPNVHAWGAYDSNGQLLRSGIATAGDTWCADINRPCKTATGHFRINSLGSYSCKSSRYPLPNGGGLMPYCMFFHGNMALHGSPDGAVVEDNISHGCVRLKIADAEWIRYNFANVGTKVIVKSY